MANWLAWTNVDVLKTLTCPLCHEFYVDPRQLPRCQHVFCKSCVYDLNILQKAAIIAVTCSTCQAENVLPNGEVEALPEARSILKPLNELKMSPLLKIQAIYPVNDSNRCLHRDNAKPDELTRCSHCKSKFCSTYCFPRHLDKMRLEIAWATSGFFERFQQVAGENVRGELEKLCELRIGETHKIKIRTELQRMTIEKFVEPIVSQMGNYRNFDPELPTKIVAITEFTHETLLNCSPDELAEISEKVADIDQQLTNFEKVHSTVAKLLSKRFDLNAFQRSCANDNNNMEISEPEVSDGSSLASSDISDFELARLQSLLDGGPQMLREAVVIREAARLGDLDGVRKILERKSLPPLCRQYAAEFSLGRPSAGRRPFFSPLISAAAEGHLDIVKYLVLQHSAHVGDTVHYSAAIEQAACHGNAEVVKFLVEFGRHDPLCKNLNPFYYEINSRQDLHRDKDEHVVLLRNGCRFTCQKQRFSVRQAIKAAVVHGNLDIARFLLKFCQTESREKFDPSEADHDGQTLFHVCVIEADQIEIVRFLLDELQLDVNVQNVYGRTPLHEAAKACSLEVVKALVEAGADLFVKSKSPYDNYATPEELALCGDEEVFTYLVKQRETFEASSGGAGAKKAKRARKDDDYY